MVKFHKFNSLFTLDSSMLHGEEKRKKKVELENQYDDDGNGENCKLLFLDN